MAHIHIYASVCLFVIINTIINMAKRNRANMSLTCQFVLSLSKKITSLRNNKVRHRFRLEKREENKVGKDFLPSDKEN